VEWLDKEMFPDPPEGTRHSLDLVARVPVAKTEATPALTLLLIHVEIESPDRTTELKPRLPYYYHFLRDKYQLPVLPIVIYLKVSLDGIGTDVVSERIWDFEVNRFQYLYVGLPGLDAIEYVQRDNWLGVALSALMRIPQERIVWLGAEALRKEAGAPLTEQQRFLLHECVESYLPLEAGQRQELEWQVQTESYAEVQTMNQTTYEKGIEKGRREECLELLLAQLEARFGSLSAATREHLEQASMEELRRLALKVVTASSLDELGLPH
jgi:hypothetical protein